MRILVYPHTMEIGGSQLNAIELAAACRDRGHEVVIYSEPGELVDRVAQLGLEHIVRRPSSLRPGPATAVHLRDLVRERQIDVLHGWEWPPVLEGFAAAGPDSRAAVVGTVMSAGVAPFVPSHVPLTVGTEQLRSTTQRSRRGEVALLEPPVDVDANRGGPFAESFHRAYPVGQGTQRIVIVSRLAHQLKLEGILAAIRAVSRLAEHRAVRLVIVGDGPARAEVAAAVATANEGLPQPVVDLIGQLDDPRGAYDAADVCIGMGGSALRALAFGKPLVVQGEGGFFQTLTPSSAPRFLRDGWYGRDSIDSDNAANKLCGLLADILDDPTVAHELGTFARRLVEERFSLEHGAEVVEAFYRRAMEARAGGMRWWTAASVSGVGLVHYKVRRRLARSRGHSVVDDFNGPQAQPLVSRSWSRNIVARTVQL